MNRNQVIPVFTVMCCTEDYLGTSRGAGGDSSILQAVGCKPPHSNEPVHIWIAFIGIRLGMRQAPWAHFCRKWRI